MLSEPDGEREHRPFSVLPRRSLSKRKFIRGKDNQFFQPCQSETQQKTTSDSLLLRIRIGRKRKQPRTLSAKVRHPRRTEQQKNTAVASDAPLRLSTHAFVDVYLVNFATVALIASPPIPGTMRERHRGLKATAVSDRQGQRTPAVSAECRKRSIAFNYFGFCLTDSEKSTIFVHIYLL